MYGAASATANGARLLHHAGGATLCRRGRAPPLPRARRWIWALFSLPPALMEAATLFAVFNLNMYR